MSIGLFLQRQLCLFISSLPAALLFLQQPFIAQIHGKGTKGSRQHDSQHRHGKHSIAAGKAQCQRNAANGSLHGCLGGIEDCSEEEANAMIPIFQAVLTALRDQNAKLIK